jgi:hypothetical protein
MLFFVPMVVCFFDQVNTFFASLWNNASLRAIGDSHLFFQTQQPTAAAVF